MIGSLNARLGGNKKRRRITLVGSAPIRIGLLKSISSSSSAQSPAIFARGFTVPPAPSRGGVAPVAPDAPAASRGPCEDGAWKRAVGGGAGAGGATGGPPSEGKSLVLAAASAGGAAAGAGWLSQLGFTTGATGAATGAGAAPGCAGRGPDAPPQEPAPTSWMLGSKPLFSLRRDGRLMGFGITGPAFFFSGNLPNPPPPPKPPPPPPRPAPQPETRHHHALLHKHPHACSFHENRNTVLSRPTELATSTNISHVLRRQQGTFIAMLLPPTPLQTTALDQLLGTACTGSSCKQDACKDLLPRSKKTQHRVQAPGSAARLWGRAEGENLRQDSPT